MSQLPMPTPSPISPSKVVRDNPFTRATRAEFIAHCLAVKEPALIGQIVQVGNGFTVRLSNKLWMRQLAKHMVWPVELS